MDNTDLSAREIAEKSLTSQVRYASIRMTS